LKGEIRLKIILFVMALCGTVFASGELSLPGISGNLFSTLTQSQSFNIDEVQATQCTELDLIGEIHTRCAGVQGTATISMSQKITLTSLKVFDVENRDGSKKRTLVYEGTWVDSSELKRKSDVEILLNKIGSHYRGSLTFKNYNITNGIEAR
jgi:hypothetical protein